jgi:hypothetical protein
MSDNAIYLKPRFNDDGSLSGIYDQNGRFLCGVRAVNVNADMEEAMEVTVRFIVSNGSGSFHYGKCVGDK